MRALAFVITALVAGAAFADSVPNKARALADRGRAAHDARDYAGAISAFTEAYALAPAAGLLFNLAQAYRLKGACDDASLMYRRYLATGPAEDARVLAELHLAAVERCNKKIDVTAAVSVSALKLPRSPIETRRETRREPIVVEDRPHRRTAEKVGVGFAIVGGAALLVAAYYGLEAHQTASEVEKRYANGENWKSLVTLDAEGDRASSIAKVSLGIGAAAVLTGATVLVVDHRRSKRTLKVEPVSGGARIGVSWRF